MYPSGNRGVVDAAGVASEKCACHVQLDAQPPSVALTLNSVDLLGREKKGSDQELL